MFNYLAHFDKNDSYGDSNIHVSCMHEPTFSQSNLKVKNGVREALSQPLPKWRAQHNDEKTILKKPCPLPYPLGAGSTQTWQCKS